MTQKIRILRDSTYLQELKDYLSDKDYVAFDTETNGVKSDSIVIGFSVSADINTGYYIVLYEWDKNLQQLTPVNNIRQIAVEVLNLLKTKHLITHNGIFDCKMIESNFKINLVDNIHTDTMILGHLLDENRSNGLKELAVLIFGEDSAQEQKEMQQSVKNNGGKLTKESYELYKADSELIAMYGAKDTILTMKLFYHLIPQLYDQNLDKFYYEDESMPLFKGPTYQLNTAGLRIDIAELEKLQAEIEMECHDYKAFIYKEIESLVKPKYKDKFNIGSSKQLAWLLFDKIGVEFHTLTKEGRNVCKILGLKLPYTKTAKQEFIHTIKQYKNHVYEQERFNTKTKKMQRAKKVGEYWNYLACDKTTLKLYENKFKWVKKLLEYNKNLKILNTYVLGIKERLEYGAIYPSFLQHGTTSGRYSSKNPNFQNLPRKDKRVKKFVVARPGNVFVGADFSQLEPRVFASFSGDERLLAAFDGTSDFYSVIGMEVFDKYDCVPQKEGVNAFGTKYPDLRDIAKVVALSATYGTTAPKMSTSIGKSIQESQEVIDLYFERFPKVKQLMLESHEMAKSKGYVSNLFGRLRRMPKAMEIPKIYGKTLHEELPYEARNTLNLAVNHRIQSTGASIMNRASIAFFNKVKSFTLTDKQWLNVRIVMQIHDELVVEGPESLKDDIIALLKDSMENTVILPGVKLEAQPKAAYNLADLK